jgi:hypothetical protein
MNCFNHSDKPAVGLCKSCLKALCKDCISERRNGLACKGSCEDRVDMINHMLDTNPQIVTAARRQQLTSGAMMLLMGIGFALFSIWAYFEFEGSLLPYLFAFFAVVMLLTGALRLTRRQQYPPPEEKKA